MIKIIYQTYIVKNYEKDILAYTKYLFNTLNIHKNLNIIVTDDVQIRELHKRYFNDDTPTDVIAFHSYGIKTLFGEIVVNVEYAQRESQKRNISLKEELFRYVTHGVLHILGYRDDKEKFKKIMWQKQENLLISFLCRQESVKRE